MANPFQAAYQGGQNAYAISQRDKQERKDYRDQQAIANILDRYNNPNDPLSYNQTVNQILGSIRNPEQRKNAMDVLNQQESLRQQGDALEASGFDRRLAGLPDSTLTAYMKPDKPKVDPQIEFRDYETIKNTFGEKFADVWRAAPQGGKTELIKQAVDAKVRGQNIENVIQGIDEPTKDTNEVSLIDQVPKTANGQLPKDFNLPKFDKRPAGYTYKEWNDEKKSWRKENTPIFNENKKQLHNVNRDLLSTRNLQNINQSKQLPENFQRTLINPSTGEFYKWAELAQVASPEAQQWVKEIARFQNRAKDAYGARVTNFDLISYMKQFPSLMNTPEGRRRILKMMELNYEMDKLYNNALDSIYKKSGLSNIPNEMADAVAQHMISDDIGRLEEEYLKVSTGGYTVNDLNNATPEIGTTAKNNKTGEIMIFNGKSWEMVQE